MDVQANRMEVLSNDLANVNTTGYKKDTAIVSSFSEVLMSRINDSQNHISNNGEIGKMTLGVKVDEVFTDFTQGSIIKTDIPTDVAIQGQGFFVVQTPTGVCYTRDGNFSINQNGDVVTKEGYAVMGKKGPLQLGEDFLTEGGALVIKESGEVLRGEELIDTIDVANFGDRKALTKLDNNLYQSNGARVPFTGSLSQGFLESANVNPVTAMVDMITVARAYEANQKVVQTQDKLLDKVINEAGRV